MKTIKSCRIQLGLSQEEFAQYLGASRSLLAKAENGYGTLKTSALMKLAALEKYLQHRPAKSATDIRDICCESIQFCKGRLAKGNYELVVLRERLEQMKATFSKQQYEYKILEIETVDSRHDLSSLKQFQKLRLGRRLQDCDEAAQESIKIRMSVLAAELGAIRKYMKNHQDPDS